MTSGLRISLYSYKTSIQLRLGIQRQVTYIQLQHVNEFNARYRFVKLYLDYDGDLVLESDFLFDFSAKKEEAAARLGNIMAIFDGAISSLKAMFDKAEDEAEADSTAGEAESLATAPDISGPAIGEATASDQSSI
jgi:hypothetical protein